MVQQENLTGKETRGLFAFWLLIKSYSRKAKIHTTFKRTQFPLDLFGIIMLFPLEEPLLFL